MSGSPNPKAYTVMLVEAGKWRQILALPPLSEVTWKEWWAVAKEMLEAYLEANPAQRDEDFKPVAGNQTIKGEINQATREKLIHDAAVDAAQRAFEALAATVKLPDDDRPANSLPPSTDSIP